eukprot:TRINITY_DN7674_c0_g5_i2.p1 TRINITY_DN7674_c0_g5~~TRINITY_DN7674_c0_g5_i2.p1  ORF type:complete len:224 (+),score=41.28 TRINITY_DN7674_c0_g5_i2:85-756(+)
MSHFATKEKIDGYVDDLSKAAASMRRHVKKLGQPHTDPIALKAKLRELMQMGGTIEQLSAELRRLKRGGTAPPALISQAEESVAAALNEYKDATKESVAKQKQLLEIQREAETHHLQSESEGLLGDQQELEQMADTIDYNHHLVVGRIDDIAEIEQSVVEIFEISQQLNEMVVGQGEQIEEIDRNVDRGAERVSDGQVHLSSVCISPLLFPSISPPLSLFLQL